MKRRVTVLAQTPAGLEGDVVPVELVFDPGPGGEPWTCPLETPGATAGDGTGNEEVTEPEFGGGGPGRQDRDAGDAPRGTPRAIPSRSRVPDVGLEVCFPTLLVAGGGACTDSRQVD